MAELKFRKATTVFDNFTQIENSFPDTEAGFRAAMKKNDILYLSDRTWAANAIENYQSIARNSTLRSIREESLVKQAIIHSQLGDLDQAISLIQKILREFQTGNLRAVTQALLIEILPKRIKALVKDEKYIDAVVLAKQNRSLFENNWIDKTILSEIAEAYNRIGIYDEAQKLYLYLIEISSVEEKEEYFLPMIIATFNHGSFSLVEEYAAQYSYNYPDGAYKDDILFIRLRSLVAAERLNEAVRLLPDPLPRKVEYHQFAALLFFRTDDYKKCLELLTKLKEMKAEFSGQEQFIYAESFYRTGNYAEAETAFNKIGKANNFYEQSLYRLAQLERRKGNEKKALTIFKELVETGNNPQWKKFAERELRYAETTDMIKF